MQEHTKESSSSRLAATFASPKGSGLPPIGVFWDIENCQVPRGKSAMALVQAIREKFFTGYSEAEFLCVCDIRKESKDVIQELNLAQVTVVHINATCKNAADDKLKQCMRRFVDVHGSSATVVLISGDVNFSSELSDFRHRHAVHVILIHGPLAPEALLTCAHEHHNFSDLASQVPQRISSRVSTTRSCELVVNDLPANKDYQLLNNRLKQLSDNCGGRVVAIIGSTAFLKFPTEDAAQRAKKRMDKEDVFGNKISVNFAPRERDGSPRSRSYTRTKASSHRSLSSGSSRESSPVTYILQNKFTDHSRREIVDLETGPQLFGSLPMEQKLSNWNCDAKENKDSEGSSSFMQGRFHSGKNVGRVSPFLMNGTPRKTNSGARIRDQNVSHLTNPFSQSASSTVTNHQYFYLEDFSLWQSSSGPRNNTSVQSEAGSSSDDASARNESEHGVELQVTNLDQTIDVNEMKKILFSLFREHVMVLHISMLLQGDGILRACVKVPSMQDAQYAISQLHQKKIGHKKILISYTASHISPPIPVLRSEVIDVLSDIPNKTLPLFKLRELFEKRYNRTISMSEIYKLRDVVTVQEDVSGRMVSLNLDQRGTPSPVDSESSFSLEKPYCEKHFRHLFSYCWAEQDMVYPLPEVCTSLKALGPKVHTLLDTHQGSLPLNSFCACFEAEFGLLPYHVSGEEQMSGIPLEHLIACIPGVQITKSPLGIKKVQWMENKSLDQKGPEISPALVNQLNLFSREIVDLMKSQYHCTMPFHKFIPEYHHHFGRQCRVADYGFPKLLDLLEALSHIVQILGQGQNRSLTLTHKAQVKRFAGDLLRILKSRASKQVKLSEFAEVYNQCMSKSFDVGDYGVCTIHDLLNELSGNTVMVMSQGEDTIIAIPKREQTSEEMEKTKQFGQEVIEVLRHSPTCSMQFNKFIPAYHHHFGRQCRVADYGFSKLIELFEAVVNIAEVRGSGEEKTVHLVEQEHLKVIGERIAAVVGSSPGSVITLAQLPSAYMRMHGHALRWHDLGCSSLVELLAKLQHTVKLTSTSTITLVDKELIHLASLRIFHFLMSSPGGQMSMKDLWTCYHKKYGQNLNLDIFDELQDKIEVENGMVKLSKLHSMARDILKLLHKAGGQLPVQSVDCVFLQQYGVPCNPARFGFPSMAALLNTLPEYFTIQGRKNCKVVSVTKDAAEVICFHQGTRTKRTRIRDEELLKPASPSPVDFLSHPIPSCVPSPEISPEMQLKNQDLMGFESPAVVGGGMGLSKSYFDAADFDSHNRMLDISTAGASSSIQINAQLQPSSLSPYQFNPLTPPMCLSCHNLPLRPSSTPVDSGTTSYIEDNLFASGPRMQSFSNSPASSQSGNYSSFSTPTKSVNSQRSRVRIAAQFPVPLKE